MSSYVRTSGGAAVDRRSWVEQLMGLPVSILARGPLAHAPELIKAVDAAYAELRTIDALFSPYRPDSEVSRLQQGELALADANSLVREVRTRCDLMRELTGGLFDATRPDGRWDPSGLVKGWAVERAARHLGAVDDIDWCLNAGGDVVVLAPSGLPFRVGIEDPADPARVVCVIDVAVGGVATSGTAARGAHLYDPRTGAPAAGSLSVTVAGPSLEIADVLATAAFVAGDDALALVHAVAGYEALRVSAEGLLSHTPGWTGPA